MSKCVKCEKTAYVTESVTIDTNVYHKVCFRCTHCNSKLALTGYAMINKDPYCKPHFKQLFQSSGGKYDRAFGSVFSNSSDPMMKGRTERCGSGPSSRSPSVENDTSETEKGVPPSVASIVEESRLRTSSENTFLKPGAMDAEPTRGHSTSATIPSSSSKCTMCKKSVYRVERLDVDKMVFHKACFKCFHCKSKLTLTSFSMINGTSYCKTHFKQLFHSNGGKYDRAFGTTFSNSTDPVVIARQKTDSEQKELENAEASPENCQEVAAVC